MRSKVARRRSVALSAGGAGLRPFCSRPSRMNWSMAFNAQSFCRGLGGAAEERGLKAQKFLSASVMTPRKATGRTPVPAKELPAEGVAAGSGAPAATHSRTAATVSAGNLPCGGILIWFS